MASNEHSEIEENSSHMTSCIHKMEIDGHILINRKQKILVDVSDDPNKSMMMAIITHTRKIDDRSISVNESYILGEAGVPKRWIYPENRMTEEEIEQFEKDWEEMWNSRASLHDCSEWDLSILFFDQKF